MKQDWMISNGNKTDETMPKFEYFEYENWFLINYYYYLTAACQGKCIYWISLDNTIWNLHNLF